MTIVKTVKEFYLSLTDDSSELTKFIEAVREGVQKTQKDGSFELLTPIEFEVSVTVKKEGDGGIHIAIVGVGGSYAKESISRIKFSMGSIHTWDQLAKMVEVFRTHQKMSNEQIESTIKILQSQIK